MPKKETSQTPPAPHYDKKTLEQLLDLIAARTRALDIKVQESQELKEHKKNFKTLQINLTRGDLFNLTLLDDIEDYPDDHTTLFIQRTFPDKIEKLKQIEAELEKISKESFTMPSFEQYRAFCLEHTD